MTLSDKFKEILFVFIRTLFHLRKEVHLLTGKFSKIHETEYSKLKLPPVNKIKC